MTLEQLVGARLAVGFPGTEVTNDLIAHLRAIHAHSLVVFEENFHSPAQFMAMHRCLEEGVGHSLNLWVDHEGGRIIRFRQGVTQFPSAGEVAAMGDPRSIERQGRQEASELTALGVRVNLAPCVDVLVTGGDPVIGDRAYGSDAAHVSALGVARIRGLQGGGVAACAKHFPGLGAVQRDPHKTLPTIELDEAAMASVHLPPFQAAIAAGVSMVMSSHVCYPKLGDPEGLPATFSARLIKTRLREELGFSGLILTDDLLMGAMGRFGPLEALAVRAIEAGHDILLICKDQTAQRAVFDELLNLYRYNMLRISELEDVNEKLLKLKKLGSCS